jgi:hypothetical protein
VVLNDLFRLELLSDESYRIVSDHSDMVFDVAGASQASGAPIILWPWHGGPNQRFRLKPPPANNEARGIFLVAKHSGKVLDVLGASQSSGAALVQWDYHGGANQLFRIFGSPIKPVYTDLVLDVVNGSQANGAPIVLYTRHGGRNQLFRLEHVPDAPTGHQGETTNTAYRIVAEHSRKVWDIEGASHENGAKLIQWDWHEGPNQLFQLRVGGSGGYSIVAVHSGKAIDVARASQDLGAEIIQWRWHGGPNQNFHL